MWCSRPRHPGLSWKGWAWTWVLLAPQRNRMHGGPARQCWLCSPAMDGQGEHWESNPPIRGCLLRRLDSPGGARGEEPDCQCRRLKRRRFNPWVERISWRRAWQPTPVFLPGKSHGQRSLAGYSLWSCTDSDTEASSHTAHINEVGGRLSGGSVRVSRQSIS